jgi:crotonobetainyl-CoA:carnitine CoA-transferase CaiB-like acyl-CoA transferase
MGALSHVRILDLSRVLAGPWASQFLADLGADVIKIEHPRGGDESRAWGPPFASNEDGSDSDVSAYFLCTNRNKKSVTIDIAQPEGQSLVRRLALQSDVVIENFKVGGLVKYGLDYASLAAANPRLVYCSITGFGQTGPYAARAGYDFLVQGLGGLMSITGLPDSEPGGGPMKVGVALTDIVAGLYASNAILAALAHRERTGSGQQIDVALLDVQVACLANQALNYLVTGVTPERRGNAHPTIVPYQDFPTRDGRMILAIGNDGQFRSFCEAAGKPSLADDARFATNAARVENRRELIPLLQTITASRTTEDWTAELAPVGVPCGPINDVAQVFTDGQVVARGIAAHIEHKTMGRVPTVANPVRLSDTPVTYRSAPPRLGEHTDIVLTENLGLSAADIGTLHSRGII